MAYESVESGIIQLEGMDGYILWPLPLPNRIDTVDIVHENPRLFTELHPDDVVVHYDYDASHCRYVRRV